MKFLNIPQGKLLVANRERVVMYSTYYFSAGTIGNGSRVKLAHLIPASCSLEQYNKFGVENHKDFRNIVSLASNIKMAFDKQCITFDIGDHSYKLIILDPSVVNEPIYPSDEKTIGEFKGKEMKFSEWTSLPNRRLSSYHAK